jgi:hypothetical protein
LHHGCVGIGRPPTACSLPEVPLSRRVASRQARAGSSAALVRDNQIHAAPRRYRSIVKAASQVAARRSAPPRAPAPGAASRWAASTPAPSPAVSRQLSRPAGPALWCGNRYADAPILRDAPDYTGPACTGDHSVADRDTVSVGLAAGSAPGDNDHAPRTVKWCGKYRRRKREGASKPGC